MKTRSLVVFFLFFVVLYALWLLIRTDTTIVDFVQYWGGSKLFLSEGNPYSDVQMARIDHAIWGRDGDPILLWNPPLIFTLIMPLGILNYSSARFLWLVLSGAIVLFATRYFSKGKCSKQMIFFLLTFYPCLITLHDGQITPVILAGVTLFFFFAGRSRRPLASGSGLALTLLKPHLLFLFYIGVALRWGREKNFRAVFGLSIGTVVLVGIPYLLRSDIYALYNDAMQSPPIYWKTPTVGSFLQQVSGIHSITVRFLPTIAAALIGSVIIWRKRETITTDDGLQSLIPVSLLFSPYGWHFDQMLLLPVAFLVARTKPQNFPVLIAANIVGLLIPSEMGAQTVVWYPIAYLVALHYDLLPKRI